MKTIKQTVHIKKADPMDVYDAYMSSEKHSEFTLSECEISEEIGGQCSMYDGYIQAKNLELEPGKLIVQSWVAMEDDWPEDHLSKIRIELSAVKDGTEIIFSHAEVPESLVDSLSKGWHEYYWEPLKYFFE